MCASGWLLSQLSALTCNTLTVLTCLQDFKLLGLPRTVVIPLIILLIWSWILSIFSVFAITNMSSKKVINSFDLLHMTSEDFDCSIFIRQELCEYLINENQRISDSWLIIGITVSLILCMILMLGIPVSENHLSYLLSVCGFGHYLCNGLLNITSRVPEQSSRVGPRW